MIIPLFLPQQGCPDRCIYCNQEGLTGAKGLPGQDDIDETINKYLESYKGEDGQADHEIAFYGGSFTGLPDRVQEKLLSLVYPWVGQRGIGGLRLSTRPDKVDEKTVARLKAYGVATVEVGAQSMNTQVLENIDRGHGPAATVQAVRLLKQEGIKVGLHLMTGLPGDNEAMSLFSLLECLWLRPDFLRIHPTLVLKGSPLEQRWRSGEYAVWSWGRTLRLLTQMALLCARHGVPVIRWGLMPGELCANSCLAGPYSPSLGEWVRRGVAFHYVLAMVRAFEKESRNFCLKSETFDDAMQLLIPPQDLSLVHGHKRWLLRHMYGISSLKICEAIPLIAAGPVKPGLPLHGNWALASGGKSIFIFTQEEYIANWRI
ncbi:radical SAM protein [Heliobacterium chlorum]|uniref:Radical SAM protein n=1 Tax=Heliobacterium chlorum TaxID=2698 RepID=A0ABR7SXV7_HELCL|nr:radical SAM protein [Heliobacterium chlorum]MBC9783364.1 radical SAM protein [Heliobacterium chlorum]